MYVFVEKEKLSLNYPQYPFLYGALCKSCYRHKSAQSDQKIGSIFKNLRKHFSFILCFMTETYAAGLLC